MAAAAPAIMSAFQAIWKKDMTSTFKNMSWKLHIRFCIHPLGQNLVMVELSCKAGWEMQFLFWVTKGLAEMWRARSIA